MTEALLNSSVPFAATSPARGSAMRDAVVRGAILAARYLWPTAKQETFRARITATGPTATVRTELRQRLTVRHQLDDVVRVRTGLAFFTTSVAGMPPRRSPIRNHFPQTALRVTFPKSAVNSFAATPAERPQ
jgi:hypothetical protein